MLREKKKQRRENVCECLTKNGRVNEKYERTEMSTICVCICVLVCACVCVCIRVRMCVSEKGDSTDN